MKVLLINGSPNENGTTYTALREVESALNKSDIETKLINIGNVIKSGCIACGKCYNSGLCIFDDIVNELAKEVCDYEGIVIGSPVYYASANGTLISFMDRFFRLCSPKLAFKAGAAVVCSRRAGSTSVFDEINKYFLISNMIVVGSNYWNEVHGSSAEQAKQDAEGLQTMRQLGNNMAYVIKSLKNTNIKKPEIENKIRTNFIR